MSGSVATALGKVPLVSGRLRSADRLGSWKARWGVGRMHYLVEPGLYALGEPQADSPVLVTANYKMSFDCLRQAMEGWSCWILVLDTNGINVWCAAGKKTFSTAKLAEQITRLELQRLVEHRRLILPQLGAPGIAAQQVRKATGFQVVYGPIRAADLPAFLENGSRATPEMRRRRFPMTERLVLVPMELVGACKWAVLLLPLLLLLNGLPASAGFWDNVRMHGIWAALFYLSGVFAGTVLTPALLPVLPGRAFALKGLAAGLLGTGPLLARAFFDPGAAPAGSEVLAGLLMALAVASYYGLNFTGSSTYTSLSGVRKEMRWAVPLQILACLAGVGLWVGSRLG